jgi:hypothetical protein
VLNDFAPISPLVTGKLVLYARKTMPAKNLDELLAWLKANPNKASAGITTVGFRLINVIFQNETGTLFTLVPYRGSPPAMQDLLAGQIDLWIGSTDQLPLVRAGSIKAYAVTTDTRLTLAPDIPTFAEMGLPAVFLPVWLGLFAPKGHAERGYRQTQCGGRGCTGRSGGPVSARRSRVRGFPARATDAAGARRIGESRCREMVADHQAVGDFCQRTHGCAEVK